MKILVPMDFKEVSMNALKYAVKKHPRAAITVLHAMDDAIDVDYVLQHATEISHEDMPRFELESLITNHLKLDQLPDRIQVEICHGDPVTMITRHLKKHPYDIVYIGSRDRYNFLDKLLGTTSLGVVKKSRVPVFVVPRLAEYDDHKNIIVASDDQIGDPDILLQLNYWNSHNAHMTFLHISPSDENNANFKKEKDAILKQLYQEYQPPFSYEIQSIRSDEVVDSLLATAYNARADLLISIARNSTFIHSLIYQSLSKELLMKSAIPVLFLHTADKN